DLVLVIADGVLVDDLDLARAVVDAGIDLVRVGRRRRRENAQPEDGRNNGECRPARETLTTADLLVLTCSSYVLRSRTGEMLVLPQKLFNASDARRASSHQASSRTRCSSRSSRSCRSSGSASWWPTRRPRRRLLPRQSPSSPSRGDCRSGSTDGTCR